jgi:hypothetical protein
MQVGINAAALPGVGVGAMSEVITLQNINNAPWTIFRCNVDM